MNSALLYVPLNVAQKPISGECLVNYWWIVHPENGIAYSAVITGRWASTQPHPFAKETEPDCRVLQEHLFMNHQVMKIPVVYMEHAVHLLHSVQKQADKEKKKEEGSRKSRKDRKADEVNGVH